MLHSRRIACSGRARFSCARGMSDAGIQILPSTIVYSSVVTVPMISGFSGWTIHFVQRLLSGTCLRASDSSGDLVDHWSPEYSSEFHNVKR